MIVRQESTQVGEAVRHDVEHRGVPGVTGLLGEPRDTSARPDPDLAVVRRGLPADHAQQGGLALPVAAGEADPLAPVELEIDPVEEGTMAVGQGNLAQAEEGH